jgi:hypothetical protein
LEATPSEVEIGSGEMRSAIVLVERDKEVVIAEDLIFRCARLPLQCCGSNWRPATVEGRTVLATSVSRLTGVGSCL